MKIEYDKIFLDLVEDFSLHNLVEGIMLAGSRATGQADKNSDYDLYIYSFEEIPLQFRHEIANKYFNYSELNNRTWEQEDAGFFKGTNTQIDIVYRNIDWINGELENVVKNCNASTGYTTCLWANFINSKILFDRNGLLKQLFTEYNVPYPDELQKNIITKNLPLLDTIIPAYTHQIQKALKRNDLLSVNHRLAAYFESYFDVLFAINNLPHPGEKRMLKIATEKCRTLPRDFQLDLNEVMTNVMNPEFDLVGKLQIMAKNLSDCVE